MKNTGAILVELQEHMGSDASVANAAWTSTYDKSRREDRYDDPQKVAELVPRLIRDGHSVPIESVVLRFWIRLPIFSDRQHMTHRIASHNGLSGRYRTMPDDWFSIPDDVVTIFNKFDPSEHYGSQVKLEFDEQCDMVNQWYIGKVSQLKQAEKLGLIDNIEFKRAREIIRGVLPTAGMVERTTVLNLRSFANYQKLRNSTHAQKEIKIIAEKMLEEVKKEGVAPLTMTTLEEIGWKI